MADQDPLAPTLDEAELRVVDAVGTRRRITPGDYLFRQGDTTYDFVVLLSGEVDIVLQAADGEHLIGHHDRPGRFLGELSLLSGRRVVVSARVTEAGEVIVVPRAMLRDLMGRNPRLGDKILSAFLARRSGLQVAAAGAVRLVGSRFSPETLRLREFMVRNGVGNEWVDPERDEAIEASLRELGVSADELPVVFTAGTVLRRPSLGELAEFLGLTVTDLPGRVFDLVVVGGGPAGLAAAVYGASEGLATLLVERGAVGGQAATTSRIENYLGFPTGISGPDLTLRAVAQAEKFGAELTVPCTAVAMREESGHLVVRLSNGVEVGGRAVIAASGARYRRLDAERLADFEGSGVFYAATEIEARTCAPSPVVVVGGGNSAGQAAVFLAELGSPVVIVVRRGDLGATMSRYLIDRIEGNPRIALHSNAEVVALEGDGALASVRIRDRDGAESVVACAALFSFIGAEPASEWLSGCVAVDDHGFALTDRELSDEVLGWRWRQLGRDPLPYETSRPGLFAVGDLRAGSTKRVAAAVGEGSAAVRAVHQFLAFTH